MPSAKRFTSNVPAVSGSDKPHPTSVKFETAADQRIVEVAAALVGRSRSAFMVEAAVKAGREVCERRGVDPFQAAA